MLACGGGIQEMAFIAVASLADATLLRLLGEKTDPSFQEVLAIPSTTNFFGQVLRFCVACLGR